jgi:hypothetical protein
VGKSAQERGSATSSVKLTGLAFAAFAIGLLANLANLLNFNSYPVLRGEVALIAVVLVLIAAMAAVLHRLAQPRISFAITGVAVAILIDLGVTVPPPVFLILAAVIAVLAWFQQRAVLMLTLAAFGSVLLFQMIGLVTGYGHPATPPNEARRTQTGPANPALRPIIHLMLDSYIGLDGMSFADANFGTLRQEQEQFYLSRGFQIYPQAYGRHAKTVNALPEFLSYGRAARASQPRNVQYTVAPQLDYFTDLDRKGYRISVQTPSFVDLCVNQPLALCRNYNRSALAAMDGSALSDWDRARVIGLTLLELSNLPVAKLDERIGSLRAAQARLLRNRTKLYSLTGFRQLDGFAGDLRTLRHGEVRFIHLLLPHDPYIMDDHCRVLPEPQWKDEHGPTPAPLARRGADYAQRDAAYSQQVRCMTQGGLRRLLEALDQTPAGRDAIVLIQGDHGSRTVDEIPQSDGPEPSLRAMTVSHSAFFAVRVPGQPAALVPGRFALDALLGSFAANGFAAAPHPAVAPAEVYLMDERWIPRKRISLPEFTQKLTRH